VRLKRLIYTLSGIRVPPTVSLVPKTSGLAVFLIPVSRYFTQVPWNTQVHPIWYIGTIQMVIYTLVNQ
jgi:hypothetical protein